MYRQLFKFAVTSITILTINLIASKISEYLVNYRSNTHIKPIAFTLIAMGIIVVIYYPLIAKMEEWLNTISAKIIKSGKSIGGKYFGLLAMYVLCLVVLLYFYAKMWYHVDLIKIVFQGKLATQF